MASYAPAFSSYHEFNQYRTEMSAILDRWGRRYLLGDVGLTSVNYANWGILLGRPVCIDYAYIFPVDMHVFRCICGCEEMTFTGNDYTAYRCPNCKTEYTDRELRSRISNEERLQLFKNVSENAVLSSVEYYEQEEPDHLIRREVDPDMPDPVQTILSLNEAFGNPIL